MPNCNVLALKGECKTNPHFMLEKCKLSCNLCGDLVNKKDRILSTTSKKPDYQIIYNRLQTKSQYNNNAPSLNEGSAFFKFLYAGEHYALNRVENESDEKDLDSTNKYKNYTDYNLKMTSSSKLSTTRTKPPPKTTDTITTTTTNSGSQCKDLIGYCVELVERGDCETNKDTMKYYCSKACNLC